MKRTLLTLAAFTMVLAFTSSCKKCVECSYTFKSHTSFTDSTVTVAQECGTKQDRERYENDVRAAASLVGGVVSCDN